MYFVSCGRILLHNNTWHRCCHALLDVLVKPNAVNITVKNRTVSVLSGAETFTVSTAKCRSLQGFALVTNCNHYRINVVHFYSPSLRICGMYVFCSQRVIGRRFVKQCSIQLINSTHRGDHPGNVNKHFMLYRGPNPVKFLLSFKISPNNYLWQNISRVCSPFTILER